jgi:hypothetical protein
MLLNYTQMFNGINNAVMTTTHNANFVDSSMKIHAFLDDLLRHETILQNGYKVTYNPLFKEWQTSHPEIGCCEGFETLRETLIYCEKG